MEFFDYFRNKKNLVSVLVLGILILALPLGITLLQKQQNIKSRANVDPIVFSGNVEQRNGNWVATKSQVSLELTSPLGPPEGENTSVPDNTASPTIAPTNAPTIVPTVVPTTVPTQPPSSSAIDIPLLVISYFPLDSTGQYLNQAEAGTGMTLTDMRSYVDNLVQDGMNQLSAGSKYHGYKNPSSPALFSFRVVDAKEFLTNLPRLNPSATNQNPSQPDYRQILNNINICDYVDNRGVRQVWLFGYHFGNISPVESDMSMGRLSQSYWNRGTYGDVSNSYLIDDMPVCNHTYALFNYNYTRGVSELVEDHTHHIEAVMRFVDGTLWNFFVNPYGQTGTTNRCGWTHYPPNGAADYDWKNERTVLSNCEDWHPDGSGTVSSYSCHTVYGTTCLDDSGLKFKIWWMQNIPGINSGLTYQGKGLRNWLEFYADFDGAIAKGKSL